MPDPVLHERCTKAEAKVNELQQELKLQKEMNSLQAFALELDRTPLEETGSTWATIRPLLFPTLGGTRSGSMAQASSQLGGGLSQVSTQRASPTHGVVCGIAMGSPPRMVGMPGTLGSPLVPPVTTAATGATSTQTGPSPITMTATTQPPQ